jgi:hypothetical protein
VVEGEEDRFRLGAGAAFEDPDKADEERNQVEREGLLHLTEFGHDQYGGVGANIDGALLHCGGVVLEQVLKTQEHELLAFLKVDAALVKTGQQVEQQLLELNVNFGWRCLLLGWLPFLWLEFQ